MEKLFVVIALCAIIYDGVIKRSRYAEYVSLFSISVMLVWRGVQYEHFPVLGLLETLNFFALCLMLINLADRDKSRGFDLSAKLCTALLLAFSLSAKTKASPFTPDSLNTILFPAHVAFSFISYAFFTLAFLKIITQNDAAKTIELNYLGFVTYTIGLWAGGIWAYKAWGAYFLYSIKEIFSFVIWIYYAGLIHVRYFKERDRVLKWGTVIGFAIVIFTYIGIGVFMKNTHSLG